ncbi:MAG: hydrogenase nickel incorporation protein HypB [Bacteroidales bacterium]|jgi:hydrogenase nickel incorporation protein HypB|nr:hydrogenase nickel incorporation protein HypB [Bacteroidales bacterium]
MCGTCGCGQPDPVSFKKPGEAGSIKYNHHHNHTHAHDHDHPGHEPSDQSREISMEIDIMLKNNLLAENNRGYFEGRKISALNMVSSPGSGKTAILERTIKEYGSQRKVFIIEGDQQTMLDAERIRKAGAPVIQVNTGNGCHLDARMVRTAADKLEISDGSLLFIENVGNLVCPALFDLGESKRVVIISVTEGDDKPLKYPNMFQTSHLCLINKSDLLPYVDFNLDKCKEYALKVNPALQFLTVSARTGEGFPGWIDWIKQI